MVDLALDLDPRGPGTLQDRIFGGVRDAILSGRLRPGTRLSSSRDLAQSLGVSRNTVMLAYERLAIEGYLEVRGRGGTYIPNILPDICLASPKAKTSEPAQFPQPTRYPPLFFRGERPAMRDRGAEQPQVDFWYGRGDRETLPLTAWRRLLTENLGRAATNLVEYPAIAGLPELRHAVADHLATTRGVRVDWQRVIITAGAQEALDLVAKAFVVPGIAVVVENPCYQGVASVFASAHEASLIPVAVDRHGMDIDALERVGGAALVCVTPSHQFPTGTILPLERRLRLLAWAERVGAYVVEDDYDSDFRYDGPPISALAGLDRAGDRVIYIGTFSKALGAGLRTGFMVAPAAIVDALTTAKALATGGQPWLEQAALAQFIAEGGYRRHLRKLRRSRRHARDALVAALRRHFGDVDLSGEDGGMHLMWWLPPHLNATVLAAAARKRGVGIYPPSAAGARVFGSEPNALVLGYPSLSESQIIEGMAKLARAAGTTNLLVAGTDGGASGRG